MTTLSLGSHSPASYEGDALVLGVVEGGDSVVLASGASVPKKPAAAIAAAIEALSVSATAGATAVLPAVPGLAARRVVLVGLGEEPFSTGELRTAAGSAARAAGSGSLALALPAADAEHLAAIAEGAAGGAYTFTAHKSSPGEDAPQELEITLLADLPKGEDAAAAVERASVVARAVAWARDLVNSAPNVLYPETFASQVETVAKKSRGRLKVTVLDQKALADGGFGGILGVGQGSARPPLIVQLSYSAGRSASIPTVALVGKGITFDSGGVCIKPPASMATMKSDMAGAAAVAATVVAAAELKVPVSVTGYLCLAENMPGGNAQRPGDVVTMRNGTTVEILDTDAEGRMVLADGMSLAAEQGADTIIDVATLTGACVVALGPRIFGIMSNDEDLSEAIGVAAAEANEPSWPLPLPEDLRSGLDSFVADIAHKGDRWGGALTAGLFLREFAQTPDGEPVEWAHLDIAGPSFNEGGPTGHLSKGGTGVAVGTLLAYLRHRQQD